MIQRLDLCDWNSFHIVCNSLGIWLNSLSVYCPDRTVPLSILLVQWMTLQWYAPPGKEVLLLGKRYILLIQFIHPCFPGKQKKKNNCSLHSLSFHTHKKLFYCINSHLALALLAVVTVEPEKAEGPCASRRTTAAKPFVLSRCTS